MRFKTKQELMNQYGGSWKSKGAGWVNDMNFLFGKPLNGLVSQKDIERLKRGGTIVIDVGKRMLYNINPHMVLFPNEIILKRCTK